MKQQIQKFREQLRLQTDQSEHLSRSVLLEETGSPALIKTSIWFAFMLLIAFVMWALIARVDEVAIAHGQIVPGGQNIKLQHVRGGRIAKLPAQEGQYVSAGTIIAKLDDQEIASELAEAKGQLAVAKADRARLRALITDITRIDGPQTETPAPVIADDLPNQAAASESLALYQRMLAALTGNRKIIGAQIRQLEVELSEIDNRVRRAATERDLLGEELAMREKLYDKGLTSKTYILALKRQLNDLDGEIESLPLEHASLTSQIEEKQAEAAQLDRDMEQEVGAQLADTEARVFELERLVERRSLELDSTEIRSPVAGLLHHLVPTAPGEVVGAGLTIAEVVPEDAPLMADVRLVPRDIGHIRVGQPVTLKLSSYDFSRYGGMDGKLAEVSPSTIVGADGVPFYRALVSIDGTFTGPDGLSLPIIPGMTAEANIQTGSKTVMQYLLKPIYTSAATALRER